jgi:hypothetical protein
MTAACTMTVWPSNKIGVRLAGLDCLITFAPVELGKAPADAFRGSSPLLRPMRRRRAVN